MDWWDRFNQLQIDLTSHCNARCPGCIRNNDGGETIPNLKLNHLDDTLIKEKLFKFIPANKITEIKFNGNWGDCLMHPNMIKILNDILECGHDNNVFICTNGSMRTTVFFEELAEVCRKFRTHRVQFAVDGLEDTHHIYRRRTSFKKIVENIQAFVGAGGKAEIVTTAFDYNLHQIDDIEKLAIDLGCASWQLRSSHTHNITVKDDVEYHIGTDASLSVQPKKIKYQKNNRSKYSINPKDVIPPRSDIGHKCPWFNDGEIQIDPWGNVFPCCHMGHLGADWSYLRAEMHEEELEIFNDEHFDLNNHNLNNNSIEEILKNYWFTKHLPKKLDENPYKFCQLECNVK